MDKCSLAVGDGVRRCRTCGSRLARRKPCCSVACSDVWAQNHVWQRARLAALHRDGLVCQLCGAPTLAPEVDHIVPVGRHGYRSGCVHHLENLRTLCHDCHVVEHAFKREAERVLAATGRTFLVKQLTLPGIAA